MAKKTKMYGKSYSHAYDREDRGVIWVKGTVPGYEFARCSTKKVLSRSNMNWAEKNWESILRDHHKKTIIQIQIDEMPTLDEYAEISFSKNEHSRKFYISDKNRQQYRDHISPVLGSFKLNKITTDDIGLWYNHLVNNINMHKYATSIRSVLSVILADAERRGYLDKNVVKLEKFPKKKYVQKQERRN